MSGENAITWKFEYSFVIYFNSLCVLLDEEIFCQSSWYNIMCISFVGAIEALLTRLSLLCTLNIFLKYPICLYLSAWMLSKNQHHDNLQKCEQTFSNKTSELNLVPKIPSTAFISSHLLSFCSWCVCLSVILCVSHIYMWRPNVCFRSFVFTDVLPSRLVSKRGLENLGVASVYHLEKLVGSE